MDVALNLLNGTELFMRLAKQLEHNPIDHWNDLEQREFRFNLLESEFKEYRDALLAGDKVEVVDGLLDIIVIAWGTLLDMLPRKQVLIAEGEVVQSNLSKVDGTFGPTRFRDDGKVLKPEGWKPPNIEKAIGE